MTARDFFARLPFRLWRPTIWNFWNTTLEERCILTGLYRHKRPHEMNQYGYNWVSDEWFAGRHPNCDSGFIGLHGEAQ